MFSLNRLLGVEPSNFPKRAYIGTTMAIAGVIIILLVKFYSIQMIGQTLTYAGNDIIKTTSRSNQITLFLVFIYMLFVFSILYYIFLPWRNKNTTKEYRSY